jgi:hypothetical protein
VVDSAKIHKELRTIHTLQEVKHHLGTYTTQKRRRGNDDDEYQLK